MGANNFSGGKKPAKNFDLSRGGIPAQSGPFVGEVMQTSDPTRSGRIRVWIKTFGDESSKLEESSWFTMRYLAPFYGVTPHSKIDAPDPDFESNGHAYGMWFTPPDVGVEVLCIFAEGDPNQGFYIGCIPEPQMTHMIPAIGAQENPHYNNDSQREKLGHAKRLPVTEIDKKEASMEDSSFTQIPKPVHSVLAGQMWKAGTITDNVRGPIGSSSQRESPSYVYGINTPGRPIYSQGMFDHDIKEKLENGEVTDTSIVGRRGGHSFVMDDGDLEGNDNLIRLRTSTGHQIIMSDDGAAIYVAHGNGQSWVELGNEGTLDGYAANSVNLRSSGDINLHADNNINLNAGEKVNIYATKTLQLESLGKMSLFCKDDLTLAGAKVGVKADGALALEAGAAGSFLAGAAIDLKGATIGLNNGSAASVTAPTALTQTDFADTVQDDTEGWKSEDGKFKSIVSRAPTHEPYPDHNAGIPIAVPAQKSEASTPAPAEPPAKTAETITAAEEEVVENPVQINDVLATAEKNTNVKPVGGLTKEQTTSLLAQKEIAIGQAANIVSAKGVGKYGISKAQLESAGYIKKNIGLSDDPAQLAIVLDDSSIWTGKDNIGSVDALLADEALQTTISQKATDTTLKELTSKGVFSGAESTQFIAGIVGVASAFTSNEIKQWINGNVDSGLASLMSKTSKESQYAVALVDNKAADTIGKIQAGIGAGMIAAPNPATGTNDTGDVDAGVNELIGSKRIPDIPPVENTAEGDGFTLTKEDYF